MTDMVGEKDKLLIQVGSSIIQLIFLKKKKKKHPFLCFTYCLILFLVSVYPSMSFRGEQVDSRQEGAGGRFKLRASMLRHWCERRRNFFMEGYPKRCSHVCMLEMELHTTQVCVPLCCFGAEIVDWLHLLQFGQWMQPYSYHKIHCVMVIKWIKTREPLDFIVQPCTGLETSSFCETLSYILSRLLGNKKNHTATAALLPFSLG